ncbi:MAG: type II secretion system GspH family protein [Heliobacteriaceae bacterium]|jgi:prepilin-type N-terminal cleavage/methylation domain-containing protein|nr:type II secretion system GspH family protein [Heliobacteriaceae bacterium]
MKKAFTLSGATHVAMQHNIRNSAFTLAEVLITLGIIGVVAALTMPSLIANYRKKEIITKLKREYSVLSQAVERSKVDNGDIGGWDWSLSTQSFIETYLLPYLNISKNCGTTGTDCWLPDNKVYGLDGSVREDISGTDYYKIVLNDGTYLAPWKQDVEHMHIYIDINGAKQPNTYGIDAFTLTLVRESFVDYAHDIEKPGLYFFGAGLARTTLLSRCSKSSSGDSCGALYQYDGWKISPDVNWK